MMLLAHQFSFENRIYVLLQRTVSETYLLKLNSIIYVCRLGFGHIRMTWSSVKYDVILPKL